MNGKGEFFGKYRGTVSDNQDPNSIGRIKAMVRDVFGDQESGWAMPCVPYAGKSVGFFMIPPKDAGVWIEFEHGDPDYPIWTGCYWAQGEVPASPAVPDKKVLKTESATLTLDDTSGSSGVTVETASGLKIVLNSSGIQITTGQGGKIEISGQKVTVNDGALEVT
jgi:uncharacterized protein involved in type VI secretion and phage assembly